MGEPRQVCILGNSHVAALKLAWSKASEPGVALRFFSAQNHLLLHFGLAGRALVAQQDDLAKKLRFTSDGLDRIEIDRYDVFVMVGPFGIDVTRLRRQCGTYAHRGFSRVERLVSTACFDAVLEAGFEESRAILLTDMIRKVAPDKQVVLAAAPYPSERLIEEGDDFHMREPAALSSLVARAREIAERVAASRACSVVWQDESTVAMPGFTRAAFNRDGVRFSTRDGERLKSPDGWTLKEYDDKHGNEAYGRLVLAAILACLKAA